jgi:2,4-dienoyl-CoA reductase (NADPH2)
VSEFFPHCFTPLDLGFRRLPNRLMMGSMHTGLEEAENGLERMAAFYAERAIGGAGLMVTGGVSPNHDGMLGLGEAERSFPDSHAGHRVITDAVHAHHGCILLQLLHAGRYAKHDHPVGPSPLRSPINRDTPRELTTGEVDQTIEDFADSARLAREVGYDGVEIMGSEGYLLSQFLCPRTNQRTDAFGGPWENRSRLAVAVVRRVREAVGMDWIIMFRISVLDLVDGGMTGAEVIDLARKVEAAGATMLDSGIGWHEAQVPTIMGVVPHGAFAFATRRVREAVDIPIAACNRINDPRTAERLIAGGDADLVSMARPWLADSAFAEKARSGRARQINTCIACNQACLDKIFVGEEATCLVNPRACRETLFPMTRASRPRRYAVVGAGPGGLACATTLAERGHSVDLFESEQRIGGQFNLARVIPGKSDYGETIRYFNERIDSLPTLTLKSGVRAAYDDLAAGGYDAVVLATGVDPRQLDLPGIDHPMVMNYVELLNGRAAGSRVAVIGAGGIGFDVAEFLTSESTGNPLRDFQNEWRIDPAPSSAGGLVTDNGSDAATRTVYLLKRNSERFGRTLGKSTGWALRAALLRRGVHMIGAVEYRAIDDGGLHIVVDGEPRLLEVDNIVICAGQESRRDLYESLTLNGISTWLIGGAERAAELDARRAIEQGFTLALRL